MSFLMVDIGEAFKIGDQGIKNKGGYSSLGEFISAILPNIYIFAGLIVFVLFIAGGFAIMTAGGNPEKQQKGSKMLTAAATGFIIIIASYWIIQIIEIITGINIFKPGGI